MMVEVGEKAPDFNLKGDDGKNHSLKEFKGRYLVVYFYPRDNTAGCTVEAKGFTERLSDIREAGGEVVGISDDSYESHCNFRDKNGLKILLLSDPESATIKAYDSYGNKGAFGFGTIRNTFVIDKSGKIAKIYKKVQPIGHDKQVLEFIKTMD